MGKDVELEPTQHNNINSGESSGSAMEDKEKHESDKKSQKEKDTNKNSVPFHKLFVFADKIDIFLMVAGTLGAMGNGLALPMMTVVFGSLVNAFGDNSKDTVQENVSSVCLNFVYLAMAAGAASFFQVSCWMCTGERQAARMRTMYLKTILRQDISYFDTETSTGEVIGTMSGDTTLIQEAMGEKIGTFLQLSTTFIGSLIIAFIKGWKLTLVLLSVVPLLMIVGAAMAMVITKTSNKGQKAYSQAGTVAEQTIGAIRTVVSFCGEKKAANNYDKSLKPAYKAAVEQGLASGLGLGSFLFIMFCTYAMALWYGSKLIIDEGYSGGVVINIIFAVLTGGVCLGQTTPSLNAFAAGKAAAFKMFQTFERKPQIDSYSREGIVMEDIEGDIELRDVHFRYPARPDVQIFSGFSLHIPKGTTTAIVGESGSGKSTVISLIERFYDPLSGEVLIDGLDIKKFQLKWIRGKIGLVSQEPILFATSILDNIAYGKEGATLDEIKRAAELANAAKFINKMPLGFETMVGEHGAQLSGGQKQRIAIARAILKNPRILLLDEATSALDAESERIVQEALDRIMTNRTTIVVAHRLTTVRNADTIAVVQRGVIVEKGPHSQLIMNPHGAYSQLVSLQKMDEAKQDEPKISNIHEDDHIEIISSASHKWPSFKQLPLRVSSSKFSGSNHSSDIVGKDDKQEFGQQNNKSSRLSLFSSRKNEGDIENAKPTPQKDVPILRLALLNKPEVPVLILGSFAALVSGLAFPLFGLLFSSVIKSFFKPAHQLRKDISFWSLMFVILAVSQLLMAPLQGYCFAIAGGKLVQRVRSLTFKKIIYQEIGWFDDTENSSGAIVARLSTDAANVRSVVGDALSLLVQNIATVSAGLVIGFIASWKLSLVLVAMVPLFSIQGWVQIKVLKGFAENAKAKYEQASQVANEAVGSIRTVASFCAEDKVLGLYIEKCSGPLKSGTHKGLVSGVGFGVSNLSMFASYALLFWVGAKMVKSGEITFGDVFKVFFGIAMSAMGVSQTMGMAPDISKVKNSLNSVFDILDRKPKIDASDISGGTIDHVKGDIELCHVSFKYPARPDVQIFRDLNISFPCGKTVALVGESGSGKSTVISLLQRFYDPDSGSILLDGVEVTKLQVKWLRMQMGLVGQEPVLFNDTIRANIAYGKDGLVSEDEIIAATQASNVHKFISSLPQGYDTSVGERGVQLSGGQKQRIAIARAIVKDPKILLLDEATSALDAESERLVQDALDRVKVNRTTIVVAHRLSTIKDADMIAVVKNGVIAEQGKHDELLAIKDGAYATLVKLHMSSS